ncbi:amidohydrolase [Pseudoclavibacter endophyticus]|uniref:Amidohydrolase n=1 Tax=Pseudoclavibacter endophyticus TaxID=1778590 RepID=A0A6H9WEP8_9MICO|nr:amidohydrolase [Pseudoclavibacter endophyticus]KAB1649382.1 amidohydrolase [Pseudoclavibacter endophyticus]GGA63072.1 amidohydrolase [Pseudoclavibacter endophyticus]
MAETADLILRNARVYPLASHDDTPARGLAVAGGTVLAIARSDDRELDALIGPETEVRDLHGAVVVPGLFDAHSHHLIGGATELSQLRFPTSASVDEVLKAVDAWASEAPDGEWIMGGSWGSSLLEQLSTVAARRRLDAVSHGHPVVLFDDSHHNNWANTAALELAGIPLEGGDDLAEGTVLDADTGETTGVLLERAVLPIRAARDAHSSESETDWMVYSQKAWEMYSAMGVTGLQEAVAEARELRTLHRMEQEDKLIGRVSCCLLFAGSLDQNAMSAEDLDRLARDVESDLLRTDWVKLHMDGVPPARTAAFLDPYLPTPQHGHDHRGDVFHPHEKLVGMLRGYADAGRSVKVHCTGDASVRACLDAIEVLRSEGYTSTRFQIAHGQFVSEDDRVRMRDLSVIAEISPFLWYPGEIPKAIAEVLPEDRARRMQPNRALTDLGVLVAGGSDWPVCPSPNLWEGIAGLVTRADPTNEYPGTLWPEQALTVAEALRVFTINGAEAAGLDHVTGSLEPGKSADFAVIDRDPFVVDPADIAGTRVQETWFRGRRVYLRSMESTPATERTTATT